MLENCLILFLEDKIMNKNLKISMFIILGVFLLFILVYISGKYILPDLVGSVDENNNITQMGEKLLNKQAPHFDLADNLGNRVKLSQFANIPVVLIFWATWNAESADQVKIVDDYIAREKNQALVQFLAINSLEDSSLAKAFIRRGGYKVPFALDTLGEVSERYNIKSLPTVYFISKDRVVREVYTGVLSERMLVDKIEQILK